MALLTWRSTALGIPLGFASKTSWPLMPLVFILEPEIASAYNGAKTFHTFI
jgi:hypothetical protein